MCRDRFTFHRCHLPASIILVDAVVGRRRCSGRSSSPRRGRGGASKDRENQRSRDVCPTRMHVDHQRPTFSPKFRGHNKTTVFPAGRTAILHRPPPLSLSLSSLSFTLSPRLSITRSQLAVLLPSFSRHPNPQKSMRRNMRPADTPGSFLCTDRTTFTFPVFFTTRE